MPREALLMRDGALRHAFLAAFRHAIMFYATLSRYFRFRLFSSPPIFTPFTRLLPLMVLR